MKALGQYEQNDDVNFFLESVKNCIQMYKCVFIKYKSDECDIL